MSTHRLLEVIVLRNTWFAFKIRNGVLQCSGYFAIYYTDRIKLQNAQFLLTVHVTRDRVLISDTLGMLHTLQITGYIYSQKHNFNHTNVTFVTELIKMENSLTETTL